MVGRAAGNRGDQSRIALAQGRSGRVEHGTGLVEEIGNDAGNGLHFLPHKGLVAARSVEAAGLGGAGDIAHTSCFLQTLRQSS
ncbi:hypothetical protein D9M68_973000 [compost metagenome]